MARILLHSKKAVDQTDVELELEYYLLSEEHGYMELYGVEVLMRRAGAEYTERCTRVTPIASKMTKLLAALAAANITPAMLRESLIDLL